MERSRNADHPASSWFRHDRYSMPKVHHRAPSTADRPPRSPSRHHNPHRGRIILHPRPQIPQRNRHSGTITRTEGATTCALNRDYPATTRPRKAQPASRVHITAPSTAITLPLGHPGKTNRHRGCTKPHPRNQIDQHPRRITTPDRHHTGRQSVREAPRRHTAHLTPRREMRRGSGHGRSGLARCAAAQNPCATRRHAAPLLA